MIMIKGDLFNLYSADLNFKCIYKYMTSMPRSKTLVDPCFNEHPPAEGCILKRKKCIFCGDVVTDNGTRMVNHIKR